MIGWRQCVHGEGGGVAARIHLVASCLPFETHMVSVSGTTHSALCRVCSDETNYNRINTDHIANDDLSTREESEITFKDSICTKDKRNEQRNADCINITMCTKQLMGEYTI